MEDPQAKSAKENRHLIYKWLAENGFEMTSERQGNLSKMLQDYVAGHTIRLTEQLKGATLTLTEKKAARRQKIADRAAAKRNKFANPLADVDTL